MDYCRRHFPFFGEDGMGPLESGKGNPLYPPAIPFHFIHCHLCLQLLHSDLGMASHHPEIKNCSFSIRNIEELVLFAIG